MSVQVDLSQLATPRAALRPSVVGQRGRFVWITRYLIPLILLAGFVGTLTILWYSLRGHEGSHVERDRPWYEDKVTPTFTDMLGALRLQMWEYEVFGESDSRS